MILLRTSGTPRCFSHSVYVITSFLNTSTWTLIWDVVTSHRPSHFYLLEWTHYWIWQKNLSSVCFCLLPTDVSWDSIFFFCSCRVIALAYFFGKLAPVIAIMDAISLLLSAMDNSLLHASVNYPVDKIEEQITFSLSHACLYLAESDDEWDDKSDSANTFNISCRGRGYIPSL